MIASKQASLFYKTHKYFHTKKNDKVLPQSSLSLSLSRATGYHTAHAHAQYYHFQVSKLLSTTEQMPALALNKRRHQLAPTQQLGTNFSVGANRAKANIG
jgi:hypothetical protein